MRWTDQVDLAHDPRNGSDRHGGWQVFHATRSNIESERRDVLDEAMAEISRYMRATSQTRATWRHGRFDDGEEAQEQLRVRTTARQGAIAAYGRIFLRFGPESRVATLMPTWISSWRRLTSLAGLFRRREPFDTNLERDMDRHYEGLVAARNSLLQAAHEMQLGSARRRSSII
jgi:hypothetical protein